MAKYFLIRQNDESLYVSSKTEGTEKTCSYLLNFFTKHSSELTVLGLTKLATISFYYSKEKNQFFDSSVEIDEEAFNRLLANFKSTLKKSDEVFHEITSDFNWVQNILDFINTPLFHNGRIRAFLLTKDEENPHRVNGGLPFDFEIRTDHEVQESRLNKWLEDNLPIWLEIIIRQWLLINTSSTSVLESLGINPVHATEIGKISFKNIEDNCRNFSKAYPEASTHVTSLLLGIKAKVETGIYPAELLTAETSHHRPPSKA